MLPNRVAGGSHTLAHGFEASLQLFQERLSNKRVKVNATMSKVIMGSDDSALD